MDVRHAAKVRWWYSLVDQIIADAAHENRYSVQAMRVLRDFLQFALAVISHSQAYITGGLLAAIAFVYEHVTKNMISQNVVLWGIGGFFLGAYFSGITRILWRGSDGRDKSDNGKCNEARHSINHRDHYVPWLRRFANCHALCGDQPS
jgi:hypothetical protein